jgi:methyl-accepting chemotaxis protein
MNAATEAARAGEAARAAARVAALPADEIKRFKAE